MPIARPGSFRTQHLGAALVSDAMHHGVISCRPETPLPAVARMMATHHVHCVVVEDLTRRGQSPAWRVLSDLDLIGAIADEDYEERTATQCAANEPLTVSSDERLRRAAQLMIEHSTAHLLVLDKATGRPAGVLSTLDLASIAASGDA